MKLLQTVDSEEDQHYVLYKQSQFGETFSRPKPDKMTEVPQSLIQSLENKIARDCAEVRERAFSIPVDPNSQAGDSRAVYIAMDKKTPDKRCPDWKSELDILKNRPQEFLQESYQSSLASWQRSYERWQNLRDPKRILASKNRESLAKLANKKRGYEREIALVDELYPKLQARKASYQEQLQSDDSARYQKNLLKVLPKVLNRLYFYRHLHTTYGGRISIDKVPYQALLAFYKEQLREGGIVIYDAGIRDVFAQHLIDLQRRRDMLEEKCRGKSNRQLGCTKNTDIGLKDYW